MQLWSIGLEMPRREGGDVISYKVTFGSTWDCDLGRGAEFYEKLSLS